MDHPSATGLNPRSCNIDPGNAFVWFFDTTKIEVSGNERSAVIYARVIIASLKRWPGSGTFIYKACVSFFLQFLLPLSSSASLQGGG